jgi:hypothetical protein
MLLCEIRASCSAWRRRHGFDVLNRLAKDRNQDSMACGKQPAVPPHSAGGWHRLEQGLLVA